MLGGTDEADDQATADKIDKDITITVNEDELDELDAKGTAEAEELRADDPLEIELLDRPVEEEVRVEDWTALLDELRVLHLPYPF